MRLYFDVCCLGRFTDDQTQDRIYQEAQAIEKLISLVSSKSAVWVASAVTVAEISRNPNPERQRDAIAMLSFAEEFVHLSEEAVERARALNAVGFTTFDSLHLACAEMARVNVFLTTDDRLIRRAQRGVGQLSIRVVNPLFLLEEVLSSADAADE